VKPSTSPLFALLAALCACGSGNASPSTPPPAEGAGTAVPAPAASSANPSASPSAAPSVIISLTAKPTSSADEPPRVVEEGAPPPVSTELRAFVTRQLLGTDIVFITVASASDNCASVTSKAPPPNGTRRAELRVQWLSGYYDFSNKMAEGKLETYKGSWSKEEATKGGIQVRATPMTQGSTGRLHVKASRPGSAQSLDAEVEVTVCAAIEVPKKKK
jgi:hypothetical protein